MRMLQMSAQAPIAVWQREVIGMGPVRESIDCCLAFIFQSFSSTLEYVSSKAIGHKMRLGFQLVSLSVVIAGHSFTWTRRIRIRTSHHCVDNMIWIDLSWQLRPSLTRRLRMNPWKRRCLLEIIIWFQTKSYTGFAIWWNLLLFLFSKKWDWGDVCTASSPWSVEQPVL